MTTKKMQRDKSPVPTPAVEDTPPTPPKRRLSITLEQWDREDDEDIQRQPWPPDGSGAFY